jgi:hypothetical protein
LFFLGFWGFYLLSLNRIFAIRNPEGTGRMKFQQLQESLHQVFPKKASNGIKASSPRKSYTESFHSYYLFPSINPSVLNPCL